MYKIMRYIWNLALSHNGHATTRHRAEYTGTKRAGWEDEPNHNGEGPEYASTCKVTQEVLGWGDVYNDVRDKQVTLSTLGRRHAT